MCRQVIASSAPVGPWKTAESTTLRYHVVASGQSPSPAAGHDEIFLAIPASEYTRVESEEGSAFGRYSD